MRESPLARLVSSCLLLFALSSALRADETYSIVDFGAAINAPLNTRAIQQAIDTAAEKGGGTVVIPAGVFRSGSIFLKSGVALHLAAGAVLQGSENIEDYPKRMTRIEGHFEPWRMALVNAEQMEVVRINGPGKLDGSGRVYWEAFHRRLQENPQCTNLEVERPRLMFIDRCSDVRIEGVSLENSGFWNLHLYRCAQVLIQDVSIAVPPKPVRAPSTDGIDIDSSQHVIIRRTRFAVDDDCIALKGSKGPLADQDADSPPVEDILIEQCEFLNGHGVLTCGSEATVVRRVIMRDCTVSGPGSLVRLKLRPDTPQRYEDLRFENIQGVGATGGLFQVRPWTQFFDLKGLPAPGPRVVRNIVVRNVSGEFGSLGILKGNEGDLISDITLENVAITAKHERLELGPVTNLVLNNVIVNDQSVTAPDRAVRPLN